MPPRAGHTADHSNAPYGAFAVASRAGITAAAPLHTRQPSGNAAISQNLLAADDPGMGRQKLRRIERRYLSLVLLLHQVLLFQKSGASLSKPGDSLSKSGAVLSTYGAALTSVVI